LSTSQIKDQSGQVLGPIGVAQDITERKRLEKELLDISSKPACGFVRCAK